eukprot:TRINITY_DN47331_c0_g1_i1.p1 TRINITY_DN47331_c0_g1~~TRINITY_DN47331_c0_g1_i1.p1  ORF type:complete len:775 (+),score=101.76 TRINITY_DN47331_c0_g1_i1:87-2327(+)
MVLGALRRWWGGATDEAGGADPYGTGDDPFGGSGDATALREQVAELRAQQAHAAASEDYAKAAELKAQADALARGLPPAPAAAAGKPKSGLGSIFGVCGGGDQPRKGSDDAPVSEHDPYADPHADPQRSKSVHLFTPSGLDAASRRLSWRQPPAASPTGPGPMSTRSYGVRSGAASARSIRGTQAIPALLVLRCTERPEVAGVYELLEFEYHNGMPAWGLGRYRIYNSRHGHWMIADKARVRSDAGLFSSARAHRGNMPDTETLWERYIGVERRWVPSPETMVTRIGTGLSEDELVQRSARGSFFRSSRYGSPTSVGPPREPSFRSQRSQSGRPSAVSLRFACFVVDAFLRTNAPQRAKEPGVTAEYVADIAQGTSTLDVVMARLCSEYSIPPTAWRGPHYPGALAYRFNKFYERHAPRSAGKAAGLVHGVCNEEYTVDRVMSELCKAYSRARYEDWCGDYPRALTWAALARPSSQTPSEQGSEGSAGAHPVDVNDPFEETMNQTHAAALKRASTSPTLQGRSAQAAMRSSLMQRARSPPALQRPALVAGSTPGDGLTGTLSPGQGRAPVGRRGSLGSVGTPDVGGTLGARTPGSTTSKRVAFTGHRGPLYTPTTGPAGNGRPSSAPRALGNRALTSPHLAAMRAATPPAPMNDPFADGNSPTTRLRERRGTGEGDRLVSAARATADDARQELIRQGFDMQASSPILAATGRKLSPAHQPQWDSGEVVSDLAASASGMRSSAEVSQ